MAAPRDAAPCDAGAPLHVHAHPVLGRTFDAVLVSWQAIAAARHDDPSVAAAIADLRARGVVVRAVHDAGTLAGLLEALDGEGTGQGLVLVVGGAFGSGAVPGPDAALLPPTAGRVTVVSVGEDADPPVGVMALGGGIATLAALLDEQVARRDAGRVPAIDEDPAWIIEVTGDDPLLDRVHESVLTVANGTVGTRGSREESGPGSAPLVVIEGVYDHGRGPVPVLLAAPVWTGVGVPAGPVLQDRRVLDLRTGVLYRERGTSAGVFRSLRFASRARAGALALRAEGVAAAGDPLTPPAQPVDFEVGAAGEVAWGRTRAGRSGTLLAVSERATDDEVPAVERLVHAVGSDSEQPDLRQSVAAVGEYRRLGFDALLAEHRAAWVRRWDDAAISIEGDPELELGVRFAQFHLLSSVRGEGDVALGARGLSGPLYAGHVFWDADVYGLPMLAACWPEAARALLEYRIRRLPEARRAAEQRGLRGARFPWESADTGDEVTPASGRAPDGTIVPIHTRTLADHIVGCVAWAAWHYAQWTGDHAFLRGPGRALVTDTARYWDSRVRYDDAGRGHIYGVVGPDEYHAPVDDSAFTNVLARWNLRRAADLVEADRVGGTRDEAAGWRATADALVDGYDPGTRRYEQFSGFWSLEPLLVSEIAAPPVAADLLLGRERTAGAQVLKQHDVLMLHHMVPEEVAEGSLASNLDFYSPRTAHGSSLAPAIEAALLARAGRPEAGLPFLEMACRMDRDDLTGTAAGGLHLATMGGVWQAVTYGFLGLRPADGGLAIDPQLPRRWRRVGVRVRFHGDRVGLRVSHDHIEIDCRRPLTLRVAGGQPLPLEAPGARLALEGDVWKETS